MSELRTLNGFVFRKRNPAVLGVSITDGIFRKGDSIYHNNKRIDTISQIQVEGKNVEFIGKGTQGTISLQNVVVGQEVHVDKYYTTLFDRQSIDQHEYISRESQVSKDYLNSESYTSSLSSPIRKVDEHVKCKICGNDVQRDYQLKTCDKCQKGKK